ncbi:MAG: [FeFe] hydrogenase H-cluster radical SAM maturase HydE [bacterium]
MKLNELLNIEKELNRDEIIFLLNLSDTSDKIKLFNSADAVRKVYCGDEIHLRGVIEFSNYCNENCLYCGLREDNFTIKRYRMSAEEIISTAQQISNLGIRTLVLQSGEDSYYNTDFIAHVIYSIKQSADVSITLSVGERGFDEYRTWKIAGADRYLLKHETANAEWYSIYHLKEKLNIRLEHLKFLKSIGYQIGSGNMIGLPMQTIEDIADDILLLKQLDVDMAAIGPFIPSPFTPYQKKPSGSVDMTLKALAIGRIVLKNVHIPATTAIDSIDIEGREKSLKAGANVIMPNFTPHPYREYYKIYPNKRGSKDDPLLAHKSLQSRIELIGRKISTGKGDSLKS